MQIAIFLLFIQPLTGLGFTLLKDRPFALFSMTVPALLPRNLELSEKFRELHLLGACAFAGIVGLHAATALVRHFVFRDDVLEAMAPVLRRKPTVHARQLTA